LICGHAPLGHAAGLLTEEHVPARHRTARGLLLKGELLGLTLRSPPLAEELLLKAGVLLFGKAQIPLGASLFDPRQFLFFGSREFSCSRCADLTRVSIATDQLTTADRSIVA
jgi:hypothetical protein